jgi:hypothetical protein
VIWDWSARLIDTSFDFRTDALGKDPDSHSPTLRRFHRQLWSRTLRSGARFDLVDTTPGAYLHHRSELGEFFLASDSVIPTFTRWQSMTGVISQIPEVENEEFRTIGYTIGGMMIFPGNKINGKQTLNGARGFTRQIADRFDLTLECIRRHYQSEKSPLDNVLKRYGEFFSLFSDFRGYVDYFLLQDLVVDGSEQVKFFMHFDNFTTPSVPKDVDTYLEYRQRSIAFVGARNQRIGQVSRALAQQLTTGESL